MAFFVIQVRTGKEKQYLQQADKVLRAPEQQLFWPRRALRIRRKGQWKDSVAAIFPGYLFLQAEAIPPPLYWALKRIAGFLRYLKDNQHIEPLSARDREILLHFLSYGEIVQRSRVYFDQDNRIRVVSGPLRGMEGRIVKVDRRKGRARVRLELYEDSFLIDFGFDSLEKALDSPPGGKSTDGKPGRS
ncbi:MAG: antiterminator LoaP [Spirochaetales bacterium]|nr:antiterminator LoaP [Spirochaetales bacterium]